MNSNTKPNGWSKKELAAARRIAKKRGTTADAIAQAAIRQVVAFSSRGTLYRTAIV